MKHHVSDTLLEDYARGHLSRGWSLAIAAHLALCPECRTRTAAFDAVGGVLLVDLAPVEPDAGSFDALMTRVREMGDAGGPAVAANPKKEKVTGAPVLPEPLRSVFGGDVDTLQWRRLSGDVSQILVDTGDPTTTSRLLRVKAGRPVAEHGHRGIELTLVLSGSYSDELGTYRRGDVEIADASVEHQPHAGDDEDCICFAVTDAPLRFRNPIIRLLQPLMRI